jgi:hypothetical protein
VAALDPPPDSVRPLFEDGVIWQATTTVYDLVFELFQLAEDAHPGDDQWYVEHCPDCRIVAQARALLRARGYHV